MYHRLVTHSGAFHADEVFSAALLKCLSPAATLERTRDAARLSQAVCDPQAAVFDVGDHDQPELGNFDHHQRSFDRARENGVPLASVGLVWQRHGLDYVSAILARHFPELKPEDVALEAIAQRVEERLIWALDAADCGELEVSASMRTAPEQALHVVELSSLISLFHPLPDHPTQSYDGQFEQAVALAALILERTTLRAHAYFSAAKLVEQADDGSAILVLHSYIPWYEHIKAHHHFVLSPASSGRGWMVETVQDRFIPRCPLPLSWAGLRDEALAQVCGVDDAIFCHRARFIASALSLEGATKMALEALNAQAEAG